ncbi:MAG: glycerate kinase [Lentisphaeria bacterium]|nr:glycerate kinase [Lentisphaeria bacterium]
MKIVIAPDKFKGNMTAPEVCGIVKRAFLKHLPDAEIVTLPMADGGEGTVDAVISATGGALHSIVVQGPMGEKVTAKYGTFRTSDGRLTGVMEMASASGLALVPPEKRNILKASTYGTGEVIKALLDMGVSEIVIGIGGSATNDGGAGMAQALSFHLLDKEGRELTPGGGELIHLAKIDASEADKRLANVKFRVACDVTNPLLGENGAAAVYGPQKGADSHSIPILEAGLTRLAEVWKSDGMLEDVTEAGDGAAGGLGAGLRAFCKAEKVSGAHLVMDVLEYEKHLQGSDLVILGEGCTDSQTDSGKICSEAAKTAKKHHVPALLLSGALLGSPETFAETFDCAFSTSTGGHKNIEETLSAGKKDLYFTALNIAALVKLMQK